MNNNIDISDAISLQTPLPSPHSCGCGKEGGCGSSNGCSDGECGSPSASKCQSCGNRATKLDVYNWLSDIPEEGDETRMVEVQFKNTRKGYFLNANNIELYKSDMVAVEASPGHDIGFVTLTGKLVQIQMKKNHIKIDPSDRKRIYRLAKETDREKYHEAKAREGKTMIRARQIAEELGLNMKIGDVEFQGDASKAIFYYIADERVDFRQLIRIFAEEFKVRIEMKQIGARQEAGRIGGIGPCGRELCCSSWNTNFVSVTTAAARIQDLSLNPQKLAGQCGKLKCCLNYEIDQYIEAYKKLPPKEITLETLENTYFHFKTDVFAGEITYSTDKHLAVNLVTIPKERVFEIIKLNKEGIKPENLLSEPVATAQQSSYSDILQNESITRFDSAKKKKRKNNRNHKEVSKNAKKSSSNKTSSIENSTPKPQRRGRANTRRNFRSKDENSDS